MKNHNITSLSGRLTKDVKKKEFENGIRYSFTLAVNSSTSEDAVFFPVYFWLRESLKQADDLKKGSEVMVVGRIFFREYKDGDVVKNIGEVKADGLAVFNDENMPPLFGYIGQLTAIKDIMCGVNMSVISGKKA